MNYQFREPHTLIQQKYDQNKIHNCPNCHCNNSHQTYLLTKPFNQNLCHRLSSPPKCTYPSPQNTHHPYPDKIHPLQRNPQKNPIPQNIYYHRQLDRSSSHKSINSINSNKSYTSINSNQYQGMKIITSPKKSINVSFRYLSPSKQQHRTSHCGQDKPANPTQIYNKISNTHLQHNQYTNLALQTKKYQTKPLISYHNYPKPNQYTNQYLKQVNNQFSEDTPKIPSILKKKSLQKKRDKSRSAGQFSRLILEEQKQLKNSKIDIENKSRVSNKNQYKQSSPSTQYALKGQSPNPTNYDLLIEEERTVAHELLRDLKLNYDYYETADISKYSNNAL